MRTEKKKPLNSHAQNKVIDPRPTVEGISFVNLYLFVF